MTWIMMLLNAYVGFLVFLSQHHVYVTAKCSEKFGYMCIAGNGKRNNKDNAVLLKTNHNLNANWINQASDKKKARLKKVLEWEEGEPLASNEQSEYPDVVKPITTEKPTARQVLQDWVRDLPNGLFNVNNRKRLASLFERSFTRGNRGRQLRESLKRRHRRRQQQRHDTAESNQRDRNHLNLMVEKRANTKILPYHPSVRFRHLD